MIKYTYLFQWNITADNELLGRSNQYINVIAEWDGHTFYGCPQKPLITMQPINLSFAECCWVKNWDLAHSQIEQIAQDHFATLARQERINRAKAELLEAGEIINNPVLERYDIINGHIKVAV